MTVKELLERMDGKEINEWMAFYNLSPFGDERADIRQAITSCVMANAWSKQKHKVEDFMPTFKQRKKKQSLEEMKAVIRSLNRVKSKGQKINGNSSYVNSKP